jgi:yecA family protein
MPEKPIDFDKVQNGLDSLRIPLSASELHGSVTGCLCAGAELTPRNWLAFALTDAELDGLIEPGTALAEMYQSLSEQLAGEVVDFGFDLLLPSDERPVSDRGPALIDWCRGFLGGFGVVPAPGLPLSEEAEEALQDLAKIAASDLDYHETEADEEALSDVREYIRIAAILLYSERVLDRPTRGRLN